MKNVILKVFVLFLALWPSLNQASTSGLNYYCGCRGKLQVNPSGLINFLSGPEFGSCSQTFDRIYYDPQLDVTGEYAQEFDKFTRKKDQDGLPICNSTEIKDYLSSYRKLQKEGEDILESKVDVNICDANTTNKGEKGKITECREALVDLLGENEKTIYNNCKIDFRNRGKSKQIDRCVRSEAYRLLLDTNDAKFYNDVCPKDPRDAQLLCVNNIRSKLSDSYFKKEVAMCTAPNGFNTETSVRICKDVLISKILAFSTFEEKNKLLQCISVAIGEEAINKCVSKFLSPNDEKEKEMLDAISAKYCPEKDFPAADQRQKCLEDILLENLQDFPLDEKCKSIQDQTEQKKCQRLALYQKMLNSAKGDVYDCWSREKFDSMKDRATCSDISKTGQEAIQKCLALPEPESQIQCLEQLAKRKDLRLKGHDIGAEEAARALEKILKGLGIDTSSCQQSKNKFDCLKNQYDLYKAQQAEDPNDSGVSQNEALSSDGKNKNVPGGMNLDKSKDNSKEVKGLGPNLNFKFSGGLVGLFNNLRRSISYRKSPYSSCKCLGKVGTLSVFDRVRLFLGTKKITKDLQPDKISDQKESLNKIAEHDEKQSTNMQTSVAVSEVKGAQAEQCKALAIEETKKAEAEKLPPPRCGGNAVAQIRDAKTRLYVQQIERANNSYHAQLLYEEWNQYLNGEIVSRSIDTIDLDELMKESGDFEEKEIYTTTIQLFGFFISSAHAKSEVEGVPLQGAALGMVKESGVEKKDLEKSAANSKGISPLTESEAVKEEGKKEKKEYMQVILRLLDQAKKYKAIKDTM
jgi:hypothetical protein